MILLLIKIFHKKMQAGDPEQTNESLYAPKEEKSEEDNQLFE